MVTPPATGETLTLVKAQPITQNTSISTLATFRTAAFEEALDWIMKGVYRVLDMASRSPQLRQGDTDGSGYYDFNGNQASNLGTPTDDGDAATVGWSNDRYDQYLADVDQQVIDAEAAQAAAEAAAVATAADAISTAADAVSTAADVVSADAAEAAAIAAQAGAEAALASTLTAYDNFDDRYLGPKASDPALDNDGDALVAGQLYFNTTSEGMFVYTGSSWVAAYVSGGSFLPLVGGTMTGNLTLAGAPTADLHAATKKYVDDNIPSVPVQSVAGETGTISAGALRTAINVADGADVTGTANVTAAGALMDSELADLAAVKAINQSLVTTAQPTFKAVTETRFAVTGTTPAIDPANGGVQTWTLSGNSTPTDSLGDGESVTLHINDGTAYTITWSSLVDEWIGGSAPTLPTTGYAVIELWKINTTVYAAAIGDLS